MAVHNADIADTFNRLADLLEIEGANPFRIRAYRNAAQTIEDLPRSAAEMVARISRNCRVSAMIWRAKSPRSQAPAI
jgi:DNA polymerase/3'-5' exonuclease PolX